MAIKVEVKRQEDDGYIHTRWPTVDDGIVVDKHGNLGIALNEGTLSILTITYDGDIHCEASLQAWMNGGWRPLPKGSQVVLTQG